MVERNRFTFQFELRGQHRIVIPFAVSFNSWPTLYIASRVRFSLFDSNWREFAFLNASN